jgi:hypothetical protein
MPVAEGSFKLGRHFVRCNPRLSKHDKRRYSPNHYAIITYYFPITRCMVSPISAGDTTT